MDQFDFGIPRCHIPDVSHHLYHWDLKIKLCMVGKEKRMHCLCVCRYSPDGQILGICAIIYCALICKDIILLLWKVGSVVL